MNRKLIRLVVRQLADRDGGDWAVRRALAIAGGDTNQALVLECRAGRVFVKYCRSDDGAIHQSELAALQEIATTQTIHVPRALLAGWGEGYSFLVLEHLALERRTTQHDQRLGTDLAMLHRLSQPHFGWHRDNYIGRTPQSNDRSADWIRFFAEQRIEQQLGLLDQSPVSRQIRSLSLHLIDRLGDWFDGYRPQASLLHGDLWAGNVGALGQLPIIFDPASYYGDRETDLAMTELFGGFDPAFYRAYEALWPLDAGYRKRRPLYQLYHVLNHANMFGGSYVDQSLALLQRLLGEL